jgi:predicted esterase
MPALIPHIPLRTLLYGLAAPFLLLASWIVPLQASAAATDLAPTGNPNDPVPPAFAPGREFAIDEFDVYVPANLTSPAPVLLALGGMGWSGPDFGRLFQAEADRRGWIIASPTFDYGDWTKPEVLRLETEAQLPRIVQFVQGLPNATGLNTQPQILVYGFSRGAQTADRLALAYPDLIAGVVSNSAGTYTLPVSTAGARPLTFPFGTADFKGLLGQSFEANSFARVPFWIGVGAADSDPVDVPHEWDPYLGNTRLARAGRFADWLKSAGVNAQVHVFAGLGHAESDLERSEAVDFLASCLPAA